MLLLFLSVLILPPGAAALEPLPVGAVCSAEACYSAHLQRKSFTEAWRACRERGGNLASIKKRREADLVEELLEGMSVRKEQRELKLWLGLQRQPRQCSPHKALRGFTWMTGDQDTWYTNWLREEMPASCPAARCVVLSYGVGESARSANFKWLDGSCLLAVDGYLCRYAYRGMCQRIELGPGAVPPATYDTPFGVTSALLRHVPFGSVASLPCGGPRGGGQSLLCMAREGGLVGWSRDPPYCREEPPPARSWCGTANGGCQHTCLDEGAYYHCLCEEGYQLEEDGRSCTPLDACAGAPCQFFCADGPAGFACSCPEGYQLAQDRHRCLDLDECALGPCDQDCVNTPGSYFCRCHPGYQLEGGQCRDLDECLTTPCGQLCANTEGSYQCYCEVGFTLAEGGGGGCTDVDECQYLGTCQQMCVNYLGHYQCHCEEGYSLEPDGFSCRPRPHPPSPPWSRDTPPTPSPDGDWDTTARPGRESETEAALRAGGMHPTSRAGVPERAPVPVWTPAPKRAPVPERTPTWSPPTEAPDTAAANTMPGQSSPFTTPRRGAAGGHSPGDPERRELTPTARPQERSRPVRPSEGGPEEPAWRSRDLPEREAAPVSTTGGTSPAPAAVTGETTTTDPRPVTESTLEASGAPDAHHEYRRYRDDRWLLIALLVPICVFVVVMLALAIVYCTRCACSKTRRTTHCYRWVHNSAKSPAPDSNTGNVNSSVWEPGTPGQFPSVWRTDITDL